MFLNTKRLVSIATSTLVLSLVSASANAQGTWYTNKALWESLVTNVQTAEYDPASQPNSRFNPWIENGITATTTDQWYLYSTLSFLTTNNPQKPVTFTFEGNAFGGYFAVDSEALDASSVLTFTVDGSQSRTLNVGPRSSYTFLGYISNSSSNINVTVTPSLSWIAVDSFSRANGTNTSNPGSNVAPEPGSFALALTGGAALLGICVRRRRNAG